MSSPWMGCVQLNNTNVNSLLTLLETASKPPNLTWGAGAKVQYVSFQLDVAAGSDILYIGSPDVSATNWGLKVFAGQGWPFPSFESSLVALGDIYLYMPVVTINPNYVGIILVAR